MALLHYWHAHACHRRYIQQKLQRHESRTISTRKQSSAELDELKSLLTGSPSAAQAASQAHVQKQQQQQQQLTSSTLTADEELKKLGLSLEVVTGSKELVDRPDLKSLKVAAIYPLESCSPATAVTYSNLGSACYHLQQYALALNCYNSAMEIRSQCLEPASEEYVDVASSLNNIGVCLHALNRHKESHAYFLSAEELMLDRLDSVHPRINTVKNNIEKIVPKRKKLTIAPESIQNAMVRVRTLELRKFAVQPSATEKLLETYGPKKKEKEGKKGGKGKGKKKK